MTTPVNPRSSHHFGWRIEHPRVMAAIYQKDSGVLAIPAPFKLVTYKRRLFLIMTCDINNVTAREYKVAMDFAKRYLCSRPKPRFYEMDL